MTLKSARLVGVLLALGALVRSPALFAYPAADLHLHPWIEEGVMSWMYFGCFDCPLQAKGWNSVLSSKANSETFQMEGVRLAVVSFYAHPFKSGTLRDSIRRQVAAAQRFLHAHPDWLLARSADEAIGAFRQGKKVMVFSLEGASGILESEEDLGEFVDRDGIRIVTLLHLTDDHLGGAALMPGFKKLANPLAWLRTLFARNTAAGVTINDLGLSEEGLRIAQGLIRHHVWIDLSHASDAAQARLIPLLKEAGQPLLYTHTVLRKYHEAERGISAEQLQDVRATGGVIGLMPSHEMLEGTPGKGGRCDEDDLLRLVLQYNEAAQVLGPESVFIGTDFNAPLTHLRPACASDPWLKGEGFYKMSQLGDLIDELKRHGGRVPERAEPWIANFFSAWAKIR